MKKLLLAICAGLALSASAQTFKLGEAFAYDLNDFTWFDNDETYFAANSQWPAKEMLNAAVLEDNLGLAMIWYASTESGGGWTQHVGNLETCQTYFPVVASPWDDDAKAIKIQNNADGWWGYYNVNFALPKMEKDCRIRLVYRVDIENWDRLEPDNKKPFHVRLTDSDQTGCFTEPMYEELVENFWDKPGFRVVDLYYQPNGQTYLALTSDGAGISVGDSRPALYIQEVSVVPVSLLPGDDHTSGQTVVKIEQEAPAIVTIEAGDKESINEISAAAKAAEGIYDLQGRKLAAPVKGLNIINGVKTFVK